MMIPKKKYQKTKTVTRLPSPILTVTRKSNTSIPFLTVTSSASNDDCFIEKDYLGIKLAGATFNGTQGEPRQELYKKLDNLLFEDRKKRESIKFDFKLDKSNKYDSNAIEVLINLPGSQRDGWSAGWIPKIYNKQLIEYFSNCDGQYENNITKIKDSKIYTVLKTNDINFLYIVIPIAYNLYDLFPRPNRFALINL